MQVQTEIFKIDQYNLRNMQKCTEILLRKVKKMCINVAILKAREEKGGMSEGVAEWTEKS